MHSKCRVILAPARFRFPRPIWPHLPAPFPLSRICDSRPINPVAFPHVEMSISPCEITHADRTYLMLAHYDAEQGLCSSVCRIKSCRPLPQARPVRKVGSLAERRARQMMLSRHHFISCIVVQHCTLRIQPKPRSIYREKGFVPRPNVCRVTRTILTFSIGTLISCPSNPTGDRPVGGTVKTAPHLSIADQPGEEKTVPACRQPAHLETIEGDPIQNRLTGWGRTDFFDV